MTAQLTVYAMDCPLPAIRPDSYVERMTPGLWCLRTPSCWEGTTNLPIKMEEGEIPDDLIKTLISVGEVDTLPSEKYPGTAKKYFITGGIIDPAWWENLAVQDELGGLDLAQWGIEVKDWSN